LIDTALRNSELFVGLGLVMRFDLLHAQAGVDWVVAQLPSFQGRIDTWLKGNIEIAIKDPDPGIPNYVIVAVEKEALPLSFVVEVGAHINSIRSSLDVLATALAYRYQVPKPEDVYFPVAGSEASFKSGGYKGADLVKGLPAPERTIIESLKPYQGGNDLLWSLHRLDIVRKHKRLLETAIYPRNFSVMGWGLRDAFTPTADWVSVSATGETVLGLIMKGVKAQINFTPYIALNEPGLLARMPIMTALEQFAAVATAIIAKFDTP
jgi:hypothetical protein